MTKIDVYKEWKCVYKAKWVDVVHLPDYAWDELMKEKFYKDSGTTWFSYGQDGAGIYIKQYTDCYGKIELMSIWRGSK